MRHSLLAQLSVTNQIFPIKHSLVLDLGEAVAEVGDEAILTFAIAAGDLKTAIHSELETGPRHRTLVLNHNSSHHLQHRDGHATIRGIIEKTGDRLNVKMMIDGQIEMLVIVSLPGSDENKLLLLVLTPVPMYPHALRHRSR